MAFLAVAAPAVAADPAGPDTKMYRAIVADVSAGVPYYHAAAVEYAANDYQTESVLGWRQPTLYLGLAWMGPGAARAILWLLVGVLVWRGSQVGGWPCGVLVAHACLFVAARAPVYFTEPWAGVCLGLAVLASLRGRDLTALGWAWVALCLRELAAPGCAALALLAGYRKGRSALVAWLAAGFLYGLLYASHAVLAVSARPSEAVAHPHSWVFFGGVPFLLTTIRFTGILPLLPAWVTGAYVVALIAGIRWVPAPVRVVGLTYAAVFLIAGQSFDGYWGAITAPLWAIWIGTAWHGFRSRPVHDTATDHARGHADPDPHLALSGVSSDRRDVQG